MDKEGKRRACYQHCCLQYLSGNKMTNETFRGRLRSCFEMVAEFCYRRFFKDFGFGKKERSRSYVTE